MRKHELSEDWLVTWNLPSGDLPYYDWELGEVGYNK